MLIEMHDWNNLTIFAASGDEQAFGAVVKQHVGLVYTAAQRQLSDKAAIEDVVQSTFILLARKAGTLKPDGSLGAWLYRAACNKAREHQKSETRRKRREQEATMVEDLRNQEATVDWSLIAPILDEAMAALGHKDRAAVIMRFFEGRPLGEVGVALGVSEDAAQKRVSRALKRLRDRLEIQGIDCTTGALGGAIGGFGIVAVSESLVQSTIESAVSAGASASASVSTFLLSMKLPLVAAFLLGILVHFSLRALPGSRPNFEPDIDDLYTFNQILGEAIDLSNLQVRGIRQYAPNSKTPYTGWAKSDDKNTQGNPTWLWLYEDGEVTWTTVWRQNRKVNETHYKYGYMEKNGWHTAWYENGVKKLETHYKNGVMNGRHTEWDETV
ncbi:MAG: RNA polymerase sigma factor (sigma-70 family) [Verrucomicrobiales bacterium]|jgi:RNA polymerase sigma factor (sigma-70 family)